VPLRACTVDVAPIRAEPRDDAEQVTQALFLEQLDIQEEQGEWARVLTPYGYPGWIRTRELASGDAVAEARAYLGTPYLWGGMTERGIDCSGLVHMSYRRLGRLVPRDADQQEDAGRPVAEDDLRPGDLITYGEDTATHVAFWLGDGRILHSTEREDANGVLEEEEPPDLRARRRKLFRLV
jgi:cell wall-associated NlpC family hydrolase